MAREPRTCDRATSPELRVEPVDQSAQADGMKPYPSGRGSSLKLPTNCNSERYGTNRVRSRGNRAASRILE